MIQYSSCRCRLRWQAFGSLLCLFIQVNWLGAAISLEANTNRMNQLERLNSTDSSLALRTTGEDPFIYLAPFDSSSVSTNEHILAFEYFCPDGIQGLDIYFGPPIRAGGFLSAGAMMRSESWLPFSVDLTAASNGQWNPDLNLLRLDFGKQDGIEIRIRNIQLRTPNAAERQSAAEREAIRATKKKAADTITQYLNSNLPAQIESVFVDKDRIVIQGVLNDGTTENLHLIEVQPWQQLWTGGIPAAEISDVRLPFDSLPSAFVLKPKNGRFTASIPRHEDNRDRLNSRWAVAQQQSDGTAKLMSHYNYPTDLSSACLHPQLDLKTADSFKGMAGVWPNDILEELVELGVRHITDNMWISNLLSGEQRTGWELFEHNGAQWWVNPSVVNSHDRLIRFATENGMVVSAIILVGFGDNGFAGQLQHPQADSSGHYAMPDLTTPEGARAYEAAIAFLAHRYAQPGDPYGRISNWILHNEVDYGWEWTNMGPQPLPVYLDTYIRSMRIVHNLTRQYNPHARTFISLTHHWNKPEDPSWKTYAPRDMLELLAGFCETEGDFEWGLAYHPYPQSLFNADTWNDTLPTDDFNTPLITMKNIAVLDRWMQRPEMRYRGDRIRGVILSEQGFHTPDYSNESQELQAAAFVYTWHKLRPLNTMEAFHNHRWVDHPHEGGLKLGVRTLPTEGKPYGDKKFAWEIYQALDTRQETEKTRFALDIIGLDSFSDMNSP